MPAPDRTKLLRGAQGWGQAIGAPGRALSVTFIIYVICNSIVIHCIYVTYNTIVIYMRLGHPQYSVTFDKEHYYYIDKNPILDKILELGEFIFPVDKEKEIIKLLEQL